MRLSDIPSYPYYMIMKAIARTMEFAGNDEINSLEYENVITSS